MLKKFIKYLFLLIGIQVYAQQNAIDSLKNMIKNEKEIIKKTDYLYQLGDLYEFSMPDSAMYYYAVARNFAKKNNFDLGEARYASYAIVILNRKGAYKEALFLAEESVKKYKKLQSPENLSIAYLNVGNEWQYLSDFESASEYYLKAKKIADSLGNKKTQRIINTNLSSVFTEMKQFEKASEYGFQALALAKENKDQWAMLSPLYNLAVNEKNQKKYKEALEFIHQFEQIALQLNGEYDISDAYLIKGNLVGKTDLNGGIKYLNKAIEISQKNDYPENEMYAYLYLAEIYLDHKNYRQAIQNIEKGMPIAEKLGMTHELSDFHKKASEAYENLADYKNALIQNRKYEKLHEEINLEQTKNRLLVLEAKYQSEQKEAEIRTLSAEKQAQILKIRQKNTLNLALAGVILVTIVIAFLLYKNHKNKQKLQAQRIVELETEKQLSATQALLQGQEDERSRMAKELHDGLGGLLSGVKINLNNMQKRIIITEEDGIAFEKSVALLDQSISELRRVAHNMMPESILKFGLDGAIKEFLQSIYSENLNIIYQSYHIENGLNKQLDISVYRIIQELVNNAIKHSNAAEILVQIRKDDQLLLIDVEDNGKGFGYNPDSKKSGMGLAGITSRVNYWKGSLNIESDKSSGTSVHIEIPVKD